jgi:UDP-N-acetylmuramoylalanine--D-glutamate ligase
MITIKDKKILLLGLGLHGGGVATARWLHLKGAKLIVSDLKDKDTLSLSLENLSKQKDISYVLGKHRERDVQWADIIIYNPGVPKESKYLKLAKKLKKPIYNEASLFFDRCKAPIIAVTGTRGKSTTASLIASMCEKKNPRTILAGNIKTSFMLDVLDRAKEDDLVVLELSSWQLEGLNAVKGAPHIAVVTNLHPDHLNRYKNLTNYYCSKKEIFKHQKEDHYIVLNDEDKVVRDWQKEVCSRTFVFSKTTHKGNGVYIKDKKIFYRNDSKETKILKVSDIELKGEHNLENSLAAVTTAKIIGVKDKDIKKVLKTGIVLEGRQEEVAKIKRIIYINDTTSTTPEAGVAAVERFGSKNKNIILIAGGADKNLEYTEWAKKVKKYCKKVYLLNGEASSKMKKSLFGSRGLSAGHNDLGVLVQNISEKASKGDIVLFSPAAASFNIWNHEFERGDDFVKAIKNLK